MTRADLLILADGALALRRNGATVPVIASKLGVTPRQAAGLLAMRPRLEPDRPLWSYPDAALVRLCHAIRAEIEAAEQAGRRRAAA